MSLIINQTVFVNGVETTVVKFGFEYAILLAVKPEADGYVPRYCFRVEDILSGSCRADDCINYTFKLN